MSEQGLIPKHIHFNYINNVILIQKYIRGFLSKKRALIKLLESFDENMYIEINDLFDNEKDNPSAMFAKEILMNRHYNEELESKDNQHYKNPHQRVKILNSSGNAARVAMQAVRSINDTINKLFPSKSQLELEKAKQKIQQLETILSENGINIKNCMENQ